MRPYRAHVARNRQLFNGAKHKAREHMRSRATGDGFRPELQGANRAYGVGLGCCCWSAGGGVVSEGGGVVVSDGGGVSSGGGVVGAGSVVAPGVVVSAGGVDISVGWFLLQP